MTITVTDFPNSIFNHVDSVSISFSDEITATNLVTDVLTPLLTTLGYHISSVGSAYTAGAEDIAELEDSIKDTD